MSCLLQFLTYLQAKAAPCEQDVSIFKSFHSLVGFTFFPRETHFFPTQRPSVIHRCDKVPEITVSEVLEPCSMPVILRKSHSQICTSCLLHVDGGYHVIPHTAHLRSSASQCARGICFDVEIKNENKIWVSKQTNPQGLGVVIFNNFSNILSP